MRLNSDYRRFGREIHSDDLLCTLWLHPGLPSQAEYVAEFLRRSQVNVQNMNWRDHSFYILHGFLIDCEFTHKPRTALQEYIEEVDGMQLEAAYMIHLQHPLLDVAIYKSLREIYEASRDQSVEQISLDPLSDEDEEKVEKKEPA